MNTDELKRLQNVEKEMLEKLVDICEKRGIKYYLSDGTLLGAVRHKGFIPHDDDIDITMPYNDYQKFLRIAQKDFGENYFVQTSETDPCWERAYATIRKENTTMMYADSVEYHANQGIWLDIFPMAFVDSKLEWEFYRHLVRLSKYLILDEYMFSHVEEYRKKLTRLGIKVMKCVYRIPRKYRFELSQHLLKYVHRKKRGKYITEVWCGLTELYPSECFEGNPSIVEFEGRLYTAPSNPHLYLRSQYGDTYMTPIVYERGHDTIILDFDHSYKKYLK